VKYNRHRTIFSCITHCICMTCAFSLKEDVWYYLNMENHIDFSQALFQAVIKGKKILTWMFYAQYAYVFGMMSYSATLTYFQTDRGVVYEWGTTSGSIALVYFCLSLTPGIARRLGIRFRIFQILMLFRRHIGISAFVFGFFHYLAVRMLPILLSGVPLNLNPPLFEVFGFLSLYPMILMFLTSNDYSVKKMGVWWKRLHSLSYVLVWTLFFHVALQGGETWKYLIGIFAVLETGSLAYFFFKPIVLQIFDRSLSEAKK